MNGDSLYNIQGKYMYIIGEEEEKNISDYMYNYIWRD